MEHVLRTKRRVKSREPYSEKTLEIIEALKEGIRSRADYLNLKEAKNVVDKILTSK